MKNIAEGFIVAFAMYSKIPMPKIEWNSENMKYCICFFPLIGLVIGAVMYGWMVFAQMCSLNVDFRTAVLVLIPVLITGGIHLDGLLDTADALSSYKSMEEKLDILKDSHAGAFAIIVGCCYFVLTYGVYSCAGKNRLLLMMIGFMISRALSGLALVTFQKARNTGLLRTFSDAAANKRVAVVMIIYLAVGLTAALIIDLKHGALMCVLAGLVFLWYRQMAYQKFGGITGDLAGCFVQAAELVMAIGVMVI